MVMLKNVNGMERGAWRGLRSGKARHREPIEDRLPRSHEKHGRYRNMYMPRIWTSLPA